MIKKVVFVNPAYIRVINVHIHKKTAPNAILQPKGFYRILIASAIKDILT